MVTVTKNITTVKISGPEMLGFIKDNLEEILKLSPKVQHCDIFHGFSVFLKFDLDDYLVMMGNKGLIPKDVKLEDFRPKPDGGIELDFKKPIEEK